MNTQNRIYLDHAATTPMAKEVIEFMTKAMVEDFGNASSVYGHGRLSRGKLDQAKVVFAKSINAKPSEIIITSGGTESDNSAIIKSAEARSDRGKHIISTAIEHHAVLNPLAYLEEHGFEVTYLPVDQDGLIDVDDLKEALRDDTILVSVMFANNEVGTIQPIEEIGRIVKKQSNALFHTDAVQAYGSLNIDVQQMNIDLLSVSAHKLNGPKGIGFLYKKESVHLTSLLLGGNQENKQRAGTENIPGIIGFQKAVEMKEAKQKDYEDHLQKIRTYFIDQLEKHEIDYSINGKENQSLIHVLSVHFKDVFAEKLLIQLDLGGIEAAVGSACTAGNVDPSHVLEAMYGKEQPVIEETVRFSFGPTTQFDEIDKTIEVLVKAINRLKGKGK